MPKIITAGIIGILFLIVCCPTLVFADFSHAEKIRYATESEKIIAHIIAVYDNLGNDSVVSEELINMHLDHAFHDDLIELQEFYSEFEEFSNRLEFLLFVVANTNSNDESIIDEQSREMLKMLREGNRLVLGNVTDDKFFRLFVVSSLLESVKWHILESQETTGLESLLRKQHGDAIAIRAHMYLGYTNGLPSEIISFNEKIFKEIFTLQNNSNTEQEQLELLDQIILKIYEYVDQEKPKYSDILISETANVSVEPIMTFSIEKKDGNEILSFVGTGFPGNAPVELKFTTSTNHKIQSVSSKTLEDGTFFAPIGINSEKNTFFISAKTSKTSTNHVIVFPNDKDKRNITESQPQLFTVVVPKNTAMPGCEKTNECFVPAEISINTGDMVMWKNQDNTFHDIVSGTPDLGQSGIFDSGLIASGESYLYTFDTEGVFNYYCAIHPWSVGQVTVE